jgi:hypothetical protein
MSRAPFAPLPAPTVLARFLSRRRAREACFVAVNNLFASAQSIRAVRTEDIARVCSQWGVDRTARLGPRRESLYREYLRYCLLDRHLTDAELEDLAHLRELLQLDVSTVTRIHRHVAREVYTHTVDEVLADAQIDPEERGFLERLRDRLGIPEIEARNIEAVKARQREARDAPGPAPGSRRPRG